MASRLEDLRTAIVAANVAGPKGSLDGAQQSYTIAANDQVTGIETYRNLIIAYRSGAPVMLRDCRGCHRRFGEQQGRRMVPERAGRHHRYSASAGRQCH